MGDDSGSWGIKRWGAPTSWDSNAGGWRQKALRSTFPLSYNVQGQLLQMSFYLLEREKRERVKEERKRSHLIYKP